MQVSLERGEKRWKTERRVDGEMLWHSVETELMVERREGRTSSDGPARVRGNEKGKLARASISVLSMQRNGGNCHSNGNSFACRWRMARR